jgi:hypothetical protein
MSKFLTSTAGVLPSTDLADEMSADAGEGVSFSTDDQIIPILSVLQTNSPACDRRGVEYVDGAVAGHFFIKNAPTPVLDGVAGIVVIFCAMQSVVMEWLAGRQGFAARHLEMPADAVATVEPGRRRPTYMSKASGNVYEQTRELFLIHGGQQLVLPCHGTSHQFARRLMTYAGQLELPGGKGICPLYGRRYKLTTIAQRNTLGAWFGLKFEDLGWVTDRDEYEAAKAFARLISASNPASNYERPKLVAAAE